MRHIIIVAAAALAACTVDADFDLDLPGGGATPAEIHARTLTVDTHVDIADDYATATNDPGGFTANQVDLPKMRVGGLDAAFLIVYTPQGPLTPEGYAAARATADAKWRAITRLTAAYPNEIALATTSREARGAVADGKLVAFIGMENAFPLGESVADVPMWAERGVRYLGITHFGHNQFGDSANPNIAAGETDTRHGGLSPLGEELVVALNRAGIMIDVSHAARSTMMDAVRLSQAPIIASHSGAAGVQDNPRNLDDEQLRAIAENGGVAQMVAVASYVKAYSPEHQAALDALDVEMGLASPEARAAMSPEVEAERDAARAAVHARFEVATIADFVDHIDHAVAVAGVDHVGIASDFDGGGALQDWTDAAGNEAVTEELLRRGYSQADVAKIWGGNVLRVLDEVERIGRAIRAAER